MARADWEVRRTSDHALVEQAERALVARPEDGGLATRLVHLAGKRGASALRTRFEARAGQATASYEDVAASATLLFALAAYDDAAMAYARAAALRPTFAMFVGRARSLERIGRREDALAAYDDALARTTSASERKRLLELEVTLVPPTDLERELRIRRALATLAPGSEDAANGVVDVLERLGRPAEAAEVLEARGPGRERWFERGLRVAELRDAAGTGARAAQILGDLLERLPRSDGERRRLAWTRALAVARRGDTLAAHATPAPSNGTSSARCATSSVTSREPSRRRVGPQARAPAPRSDGGSSRSSIAWAARTRRSPCMNSWRGTSP